MVITTGPLRYFAIRIGDYVEFRGARVPPRAKTSKLTKSYMYQSPWPIGVVYDFTRNMNVYKYPDPVERKAILQQVFYVGGRVLGVCKAKAFHRVEPKSLPDGKMREITKVVKDAAMRVKL